MDLNAFNSVVVKIEAFKHLHCFCGFKFSVFIYPPRLEHSIILMLMKLANLLQKLQLLIVLRLFVLYVLLVLPVLDLELMSNRLLLVVCTL